MTSLLFLGGGKITKDFSNHGIRVVRVESGDVKHFPGRDGSQYNDTIASSKSDMFEKSRSQSDYETKESAGAGKSQWQSLLYAF